MEAAELVTLSATTRVSLLRGTAIDALGDEVDELEPVVGTAANDVRASLIERSRNVFDPASGAWRVIRYMKCRVPPTFPVLAGDYVRDDRTGIIYAVTDIRRTPRSLSGQAALSLDLSNTAAA